MRRFSRRAWMLGAAGSASGLLLTGRADATLVRGLALPELVAKSQHVLLITSLAASSHYEELGGRRTIVTDTRVRLEEVVSKAPPTSTELLVRTLGGQVGDVGELVHGQAELSIGHPSMAFLVPAPDGVHWVTGMAQGHYPVVERGAAAAELTASPNLPTIRDWERSAVRRLSGRTLSEARRLVRAAGGP